MSEQTKKLTRPAQRMLGGVCAGLGKYFGIDPTIVRLIAVLLTFFYFPATIILYIIMMLVIPSDELPARPAAEPDIIDVDPTPPAEA